MCEFENHPFKVKNTSYYFKLDEETRLPIKLGDGSFGIVFEIYRQENQNKGLAVKLLYNLELSEARYLGEIYAYEKIAERFGDENKIIGIVRSYGGTETFYDDEVYKHNSDFFNSLNISKYAIVMEKYECTLKDLLERGIGKFTIKVNNQDGYLDESQSILYSQLQLDITNPTTTREEIEEQIEKYIKDTYKDKDKNKIDDLIKNLKKKVYEIKGYEILENMNFDERIAEMMPYIIDIARGIKTLHECQLLHLDLKPANIFIKSRGEEEIEAVIGDLSFFNHTTEPNLPTSPIPGREVDLPLGTRHYRSPEQKDYFDLADVEVTKKDGEMKLIVNDRKFKDTIIEEGDRLRFSKKYDKAYTISSKKIVDGDYIEIKINDPLDLIEDRKTQVFFEKRQGYRTDLFGFGAIIFDLLTCGESPEKFYEKIYIYEKEDIHNNSNKKDESITQIMQDFDKVSNYLSSEPKLIQIFDSFRLKSNPAIYAPKEIVKLIVECMLYKNKNNFYFRNLKELKELNYKTMDVVLLEILKLTDGDNNHQPRFNVRRLIDRRLVAETDKLSSRNRLYSGEIEKIENITSNFFREVLKKLRKQSKNELLFRLQDGIGYLNKLTQLIFLKVQNNSFYIAELNPQNIVKSENDSQLEIKFSVYDNYEKYLNDLKKDFVYTKLTNNIRDFYAPDFLVFMHREIEIEIEDISFISPSNEGSNDLSSEQKKVKITGYYLFLDSSIYGDNICENDWIIFKSLNSENNKIFRIESVDKNSEKRNKIVFTSIEKYSDGDFLQPEKLTEYDIIFHKEFQINEYYLHMLGIYLYNIFFIGIDGNSYNKPISLSILKNSCQYIKSLNTVEIRRGKFRNLRNKPHLARDLQEIINSLVVIYLKLTFTESEYSFYSLHHDKRLYDILSIIKTELEEIQERIARYLTKHLKHLKAIGNNDEIQPNRIGNSEGKLINSIEKTDPKLNLKEINETYQTDIIMNFNELVQNALE